MKVILLLSLFAFSIIAVSQSEKRDLERMQRIEKRYFSETDPDFKETIIPDKWNGESAVIISQKISYSYIRVGGITNPELGIEEVVRKRIKLLDKAAIEDFSKFYFLQSSSESMGIRIIKNNGSIVKVDVKGEAVSDQEEVPSFYRSSISTSEYKKLAVPGLEIGDIIDYYYYDRSTSYGSTNGLVNDFTPFILTLNNKYPTMHQRLEYNVDRGFYINFGSYNGAPTLTQGEIGLDLKGREKEKIRNFYLEDGEREKLHEELWGMKYLTYPTIKFQVAFGSSNAWKNSKQFLGLLDEPKTKVSKDEIVKHVVENLALHGEGQGALVASAFLKYFDKKYKGNKDVDFMMQQAIMFMRYKLHSEVRYNDVYYNYYIENRIAINDQMFCEAIVKICKKKKIPVEMFVTVPRAFGKVENILLRDEVDLGLRVNNKYYVPATCFSKPNELKSSFEGTDAVLFDPLSKEDVISFKVDKIPMSKVEDNVQKAVFVVKLDLDNEVLIVNRVTSYSGFFIENAPTFSVDKDKMYLEDRIEFDLDYEAPKEGKDKYVPKEERERLAKEAEKKKEEEKKLIERMKENVEDELPVKEYKGFKIESFGRTLKDNAFIVSEDFIVKDLINKAGKNYTFDLGKFIGGQIQLEEDDKTRKGDVYIKYPRSLKNSIEIKIPEGFTVEGLDAFNVDISNKVMDFISIAEFKEGKITLTTNKVYKNYFDKKDDWKLYVEALEKAYELSQKKIIIKK